MSLKETASKYKPGVPKRHLLLVAAFVWLFAGGFLMYRGIRSMPGGNWELWKTVMSVAGGLLFFRVLFLRISAKHIRRITTREILRPCVFSFFDFKSYFLMAVMIAMGVTVRRLEVIGAETIAYFFNSMAIPLLLSALRFLLAWRKYGLLTKRE